METKLKEKLREQNFHHDMETNLAPSEDQQKTSVDQLRNAFTAGNETLGKT